MKIGNFGIGYGKHHTRRWHLLPTIEFILMGDEIFSGGSWRVDVTWFRWFFEFGYIKLREGGKS